MNKRGFTVIETIIVVIFLLIIALIIIPNLMAKKAEPPVTSGWIGDTCYTTYYGECRIVTEAVPVCDAWEVIVEIPNHGQHAAFCYDTRKPEGRVYITKITSRAQDCFYLVSFVAKANSSSSTHAQ